MDWSRIEQMDPHLLYGIVNTALRDHHDSLKDLCLTHDVDPETLSRRLGEAGYQYFESVNQFR